MKISFQLICFVLLFSRAFAQNPNDNPDGPQQPPPATVPDPDLMGHFFPEIAKMPAPAWIKPGTRLTYLSSLSKLDGDGDLLEHPDGTILNPKTGKRYFLMPIHENMEPVGSSAFRNIDVAALDGNVAVLDQSAYGFDALNNTLSLSNTIGVATNSGFNMWWINPAALQELVKTGSDNFVVMPTSYKMDGKTFNAIRIISTGDASYTAYTYDTASGLLLRGVEVAQRSGFSLEGGQQFQGKRTLMITTLKASRQMKLPWLDAPAPPWVNQIQNIRMEGSAVYITPGQMQQPGQPMRARSVIKARGNGWVRYTTDFSEMGAAGIPMDGTFERVSGTGSLGGLWIAPQALQQLRPEQVIDVDPVTGVRSYVSFVGAAPDGRQAVMISQVSSKTRIDCAYDMESGMLKRNVLSWDADVARNIKTMDVVGAQ